MLAIKKLADNLDQRTDDTVRAFQKVLDNLGEKGAGAIDNANALVTNLDKRTAEISAGLAKFTGPGLEQWRALAVDGRRALGTIERAVTNFDRNPTRVIFGSSFDSAPEDKARAQATPRRSSAK